MTPFLSQIVILLLVATSTGILLARKWRWLIAFLSAQYAGVFLLALQHLPLSMATVKVIAGWMGAAILGMTHSSLEEERPETLPQGRFFRLVAAGIVLLIAGTGAPFVDSLMANAGMIVSAGGMLLIGMGLIHLGVTDQPLRVTIGLMTVLAGFEVLYATVENSILVAALLATITLGLALTGSYLMIASAKEENQAETT
jgi:hypothetical protein